MSAGAKGISGAFLDRPAQCFDQLIGVAVGFDANAPPVSKAHPACYDRPAVAFVVQHQVEGATIEDYRQAFAIAPVRGGAAYNHDPADTAPAIIPVTAS